MYIAVTPSCCYKVQKSDSVLTRVSSSVGALRKVFCDNGRIIFLVLHKIIIGRFSLELHCASSECPKNSCFNGGTISYHKMSRFMRKPTFWFPTRSDTNQAVQLQKMARGFKFWIQKVEGLYYLCSKNKGADQLRGHREADLRLCFRICKMLVFS